MLTLHALLVHCEVNNWDRHLWFKTSELKGNVLTVPDKVHQSFIRSCWGRQMAELVPGLQIVIEPSAAREKAVQQRKSPWKMGKEPSKARLGGLD